MPQLLEGGIGRRPDQYHREATTLLREHQHLVAVEAAEPTDQVADRPRLGARMQAIGAIDVRHPAVAAEGVDGSGEASGPPRGIHHEVGLAPGSVDHGTDHPAPLLEEAVHMADAQHQARHLGGGDPQSLFVGLAPRVHDDRVAGQPEPLEVRGLGSPGSATSGRPSGHSACSSQLTCGRKLWAWANCMTPRRRQPPPAPGPGSRSTEVTRWPRRASAAPTVRPVGPDPMTRMSMTIRLPLHLKCFHYIDSYPRNHGGVKMPDAPRRTYRSDLRDEQARATRLRIVAAGSDLFVERGYAGHHGRRDRRALRGQPQDRVQLRGRQAGAAQAGVGLGAGG